ncbi:hypothetical protein ACRQ4B_05210 [Curtobacterium sp. SP.BCo]|uniref:hypothetical protein n=1 Tax=Curtobacterium sp. SP.BCo TaxID=3435229 RepID=UPI003F7408D2
MRKISKAIAAAGLAAATVVSGLSLGPAAVAAPASSPDEVSSTQLIFESAPGVYYAYKDGWNTYYSQYSTLAAAQADATRLSLTKQSDGSYFLRSPNGCVFPSITGTSGGGVTGTRFLKAAGSCRSEKFRFRSDGTVSVSSSEIGNTPIGAIGGGSTPGVTYSGLGLGTPGWQFRGESPVVENGGFDAEGVGTAATVEAGETKPVRFGAKVNTRVTSMTGTTVTVTAPAGTTFARDTTTISGEYRDDEDAAWKEADSLKLTGSVSSDGRTFTGTMTDTGSSFKLNPGNTARWTAQISAPADAAESQGDLDFALQGTSNAGAFQIAGSSPATITAANGGLLAKGVGHPDTIQPRQTKEIQFGATASGKITSMSDTEIVVTAPNGSTFTPGQTTLDTYYRYTSDDEWTRSVYSRITGEVSADGKTFTGTSNGSGFTFPAGSELRWGINVVGGDTAGTNNLGFQLTGTSNIGTFDVQGSSAVTVAADALTVKVESQDDAARTAEVSGTATKGAEIFNGTTKIATVDNDGTWSGTIKDLAAGQNTITLEQRLNGTKIDDERVTVTIVDRLIGENGPPVELNRGADTTVHAHVKTNTRYTVTDGEIVFTAPAGTTFTTGQNTITGQYKTGDNWGASTNLHLTDGTRSADGKTYTYNWVNVSEMRDATQIRWGIKVATPKNGPAIDSTLQYAITGTSSTGTFAATGTTKTTAAADEDETVKLTADAAFDATDALKPAIVFGEATPGATIVLKDSLENIINTTTVRADKSYSLTIPPKSANPGMNDFTVTQRIGGVDRDSAPVSLDYGTPEPINVTSPENGSIVDKNGLTFTGTGDNGARVEIQGLVRTIAVGAVSNGTWTAPVTVDLSDNVYNLRAVQITKGGLQTSQPITVTILDQAMAPLTATAAFDARDENLPATISGNAQIDATVTVKNDKNEVIGSTKAIGGKYSIVIPPAKATFGINTFSITQTAKGKESEPLSRSLDYGNPVAPVITSPANNAVVPAGKVTFTGTGASGARVDIKGTVSTIGTGSVTNGTWSVDTRELTPNVYRLFAVQTSKGGLTKQVETLIDVRKKQVTELTAAGSFPIEVDQNAVISGNAHTGATVIVREGSAAIGSATAVNGKYSIAIPAGATGLRQFTVTQTVDGVVSAPKSASLDYGTVTPVTVESPTNGEVIKGGTVTFTGHGTPGAKVMVNGTVSQLGSTKVDDDGEWALTLNRTLTPQAYTLSVKQTTKGNVVGNAVTRTFTVIK